MGGGNHNTYFKKTWQWAYSKMMLNIIVDLIEHWIFIHLKKLNHLLTYLQWKRMPYIKK